MHKSLLDSLAKQSLVTPQAIALIGDGDQKVTWQQLLMDIACYEAALQPYQGQVLAVYLDNCPQWVILDLACQQAKVILLPIPSFFSDSQINHAITASGAEHIVHHAGDRVCKLFNSKSSVNLNETLRISATGLEHQALPSTTAKITFTSGSTGQPKGVCLSAANQTVVAHSLVDVIGLKAPVHLSVLPYSTLLENIAGLYAPLLSGGQVIALPMENLGFDGSSNFNVDKLIATIERYQPNSMILLPELLMALLSAVQKGWKVPDCLKFIAVGGAKVSPKLLEQAVQFGLPVYEGYGLSECASVVSLNTYSESKLGSTGKLLPHLSIEYLNNEVVIRGNSFLGYLSDRDSWYKTKVETGDLGFLDDEGYLFINGRKKNTLISSYGRNINPEWPESELLASGLFSQVVIFGDAKPFCTALIHTRSPSTTEQKIDHFIQQANSRLPEYAQVKRWYRLNEPMQAESGLYTVNGRPKRDRIYHSFDQQIGSLYEE